MLKVLRKKGVMKIFLWVITIGIIALFGFGYQSYLIRADNFSPYAGVIFGKKVSLEDFERNYNQIYIRALIRYGANFEQVKSYLNLEADTWDRIIILNEANRRRIKVADEDVIKAIQSYPFFQRDGRFDPLLYNNILNYGFKTKTRDFEEGMRDSLKTEKLFEMETVNVSVPEEEIFEAYKLRNEKVQISYVLFKAEDHKTEVAYDEIKAREYYEQYKDSFLTPPMVNVAAIKFEFPPEASDEQKSEVEDKAFAAAQELKANPNLEEIAGKNGLTVMESGFFNIEQPDPKLGWSFPVLQTIFKLNEGQISSAIATSSGFQIVKMLGKKDSYIPGFEEAADKVKEAWSLNEAKKLAKETAQKNYEALRKEADQYKKADFTTIAKTLGFEIQQTPVFSRGQYLPHLGIAKDFQDAAFTLNETRSISDVVEVEIGYAILHLDSILPIDMADYEKQKSEFEAELLVEKKNTAFVDFISKLRLKAKLEDNLAKLKKAQEEATQQPL